MTKHLVLAALLAVTACKKKKKTEDAPPPPAPAVDAAAVDAAAAPVEIDAATPSIDAAVAAVDQQTLCPKVINKIVVCKSDAAFAAALTEGADAAKKKEVEKLLKGIKDWPKNICTYEYEYEYPGFLEHWDKLGAPEILDDCGKLGAAVKSANGLFGGDIAK